MDLAADKVDILYLEDDEVDIQSVERVFHKISSLIKIEIAKRVGLYQSLNTNPSWNHKKLMNWNLFHNLYVAKGCGDKAIFPSLSSSST